MGFQTKPSADGIGDEAWAGGGLIELRELLASDVIILIWWPGHWLRLFRKKLGGEGG